MHSYVSVQFSFYSVFLEYSSDSKEKKKNVLRSFMWSGISCQRSIEWNCSLKHDNYDSNFKHDKLFFAASHSRGTKPPCRGAKIALGQDKTKDIHNFKWQFLLFVLSQCNCCSPARRFCTTKFCIRAYLQMRDYLDRRVTPPKRVPSPTWDPPPPCKRVLSFLFQYSRDDCYSQEKIENNVYTKFCGKNSCLIGNERVPNFIICGFCKS